MKDNTSLVTTLIAAVIAIGLTILIPAGYFAISYQYLVGTLDSEAEVTSQIMTDLVAANPQMWQFEEVRMMEILERRPHEGVHEIRRTLNRQGKVVAESLSSLQHPVLSRSHGIYDSGRAVGRIDICRSLFPLMIRTILVGMVSLLTGALVFFVLRIIPLRAIRKAHCFLRESEEKYRSLYDSMKEGVALYRITYDGEGEPVSFIVMDVNPAYERLLGMKRSAARGKTGAEILDGTLLAHLPELIACADTGISQTFELELPVTGRAFNVSIFSPQRGLFASLLEDITERKKSEAQIQKLAYRDSLTGLPNRTLFFDRFQQALARAERDSTKVAVFFLDLDGFKVFNDTLGHPFGDQLLLQVSQRLQRSLRSSDTLARLGGDEFVFLASYAGEELNVAHHARNLQALLSPSFLIGAREIYTSGSIGIAIFPDDGHDVETLLRCADMAMYAAKSEGRGCYNFFSQKMNHIANMRMELETDLRFGLEREEFFLEYQPIINAQDGSLIAVEALLRWQHPRLGKVLPGSFIEIAEISGVILPLGEWVLRTACSKLKQWQEAGLVPFRLEVNVSCRQFQQRDFVDVVQTIIAETGVDASFLELELTETSLMEHGENTARILALLKELNLGIVIDDFGTGYSSLGYLKSFPIERIKIDRSFVTDVCKDPSDRAIVEAIIAMAGKLGIGVVAEGVETIEQSDFILSLGCKEIQGFLYYRPLSEEQFTSLLHLEQSKAKESPVHNLTQVNALTA